MGTYKIRKIDIPAAGRNIDYKYKNSSSILSSVAGGGSSVSLPSWLQFVEYDDVAGSIRFKKHLLSEGEVSAWQTGEFNNNVFDNLPKASKTSHGIVRVGNGISVSSDGIISLDSAVTAQTLSFSGNNLSISGGNTIDLSSLTPDLSGYATTGDLTTGLNTKANASHNHEISNVTNLQTELNKKLNNTVFDSLFELKTDGSGNQYIQAKHSFVSVGEISAYAADSVTVPSVFDSLPIASTTSTGIVRVGYGINVDAAGLISLDGSSLTPQVLGLSGNILSLNGGGGSVDLSVLTPNLSGYTPTSRILTAGNGLTGGGDLTANRTFTLGTPTSITATSTNSVAATSHTHALDLSAATANNSNNLGGYSAASYPRKDEAAVITQNWAFRRAVSNNDYDAVAIRLLNSQTDVFGRKSSIVFQATTTSDGAAITGEYRNYGTNGGGSDLVFSTKNPSTDTIPVERMRLDTLGRLALGVPSASERLHVAGNGLFTGDIYSGATKVALQNVSILAGNGLSGGGAISANRTITLGTPSTITNSSTDSVTSTSHNHAIDLRNLNIGHPLLDTNGLSVTYTNDSANPTSTFAYSINAHTSYNTLDRRGFTLSVPHNSDALYVRGTGASAIGANSTNNYFGSWRRVYTDDYHPDADALGGVVASEWVRRTIAQTITGLHTFERNGDTITLKPLNSSNASIIKGKLFDGNDHWYIGKGSPTSNDLVITNYTVADTRFFTNGQERLKIHSAGEVEVFNDLRLRAGAQRNFYGPSVRFRDANNGGLVISSNGGGAYYFRPNGDTSHTDATLIDANGISTVNGVFNGSITATTNITAGHNIVAGTSSALMASQTSGDNPNTGLSLYSTTAGTAGTYGIQFMKTATAGYGTHGSVSSDWAMYFNMNSTATRGWIFRAKDGGNKASISAAGNMQINGNFTALGEIAAYQSSDSRLKFNIRPIQNALTTIDRINPVTFQWNDKAVELNDVKTKDSTNYGVIAQELELILPDLVHTTNGFKSVDYIQLTGLMLKAIKELKQEINELKLR